MPFSKEMILGASGNQGAGAFYSHQIEQSLRFEEGAGDHLSGGQGLEGSEGQLAGGYNRWSGYGRWTQLAVAVGWWSEKDRLKG